MSGKCLAFEYHLQMQAELFITGCIAETPFNSLHLVLTQASDLCKIQEFSSSSEPGVVDGDAVADRGPVVVGVNPFWGQLFIDVSAVLK